MPTLAQKLRADPTPAEVRLWNLIRPFRTGGYHFRKQVPLGPYIVDFACLHANLVIEVDGDTHFTAAGARRDIERDRYLRDRGLSVLRFTNDDVNGNSDGVYTVIDNYLAGHAPRLRSRASITGNTAHP
jgi:very-short-patch-repair endonuclease